ncbi:MAG: ATP-binding cassette domain-containing protein [Clostridia bacterium]|nr:ATP-binding cassette domain-containing protein [Clostridia bacterium]
MIFAKDITKTYGDRIIFSSLSFELEDGLRYILHGPSGSGKTTLLGILAGTDKSYSGRIESDKSSVHGSAPIASLSFQGGNLLPWLSALDNVLLLDKAPESRKKAEAILAGLGIPDVSKYPDELSGGMKNRVGIARCLMKDAELYLFDEPFAGLDAKSIELVSECIIRYTQEKTVLAVIHDSVSCPRFDGTRIAFSGSPISSLEFQ